MIGYAEIESKVLIFCHHQSTLEVVPVVLWRAESDSPHVRCTF